jgi:hypothetical protein
MNTWPLPFFLVARRILGLVGLGPRPDDKDIEIAILRHQLAAWHPPGYPPALRTN